MAETLDAPPAIDVGATTVRRVRKRCPCPGRQSLPRGSPGRGEQVLIDEAGRLNATDLARAGRHLLRVIDPDAAERRAEKDLDRQQRAAHLGRHPLDHHRRCRRGPAHEPRERGGRRDPPRRTATAHQASAGRGPGHCVESRTPVTTALGLGG